MTLEFISEDHASIPILLCNSDTVKEVVARLAAPAQRWIAQQGFTGGFGEAVLCPTASGEAELAILGLGDTQSRARNRFILAAAAAKLPSGVYKLPEPLPLENAEYEVLGWLLLGYAFDRYRSTSRALPRLIAPSGMDARHIESLAKSEALCRDLINTPASDMGPAEIEVAARQLAAQYHGTSDVIIGEALIDQNFPMIHAVGRASPNPPRLIDLGFGTTGPKLTLVGKGVCFDTGGLNLKPGSSMGLMKKDMGGAAHALALAQLILDLNLPLQLRVLIPAVENAVSGASFRPQDILISRKGLSVEINNTDAEGRLVLGDALSYASEDQPDLIVSLATLTGAARVALGPQLAPFYTNQDATSEILMQAGKNSLDPLWRLPFWEGYEPMIEPGIADLDNAPAGGFAGSITAALFLRRFVAEADKYIHFDIYGWAPKAAAGITKGGTSQGIRALASALPKLLSL